MQAGQEKILFINMLKSQIGGSYLSNLDFIEDLRKNYRVQIDEVLILDNYWKKNGIQQIPKIKNKKIIFHNIWDIIAIPADKYIKKIVSAIVNNIEIDCIGQYTVLLGHETLLWLAPEFKHRFKKNIIFSIHHGTPTHSIDELNIDFRNKFISRLKAVKSAITVSRHLSKNLSNYSDTDCIYIPNYPKIDTKKKNKEKRKKIRLIQISTFRKIKRPLDGISICQSLKNNDIDSTLTIVGFGKYCDKVEISKGLDIKLIPYLGRKELAKTITNSDFLFLPSSKEGLPRVVIEAMQCGVPPVVSTGANRSNIVEDEINGLVFETGNIVQATKKIIYCNINSEKYMKLVTNGLKRVVLLRNERERGFKQLIDNISQYRRKIDG